MNGIDHDGEYEIMIDSISAIMCALQYHDLDTILSNMIHGRCHHDRNNPYFYHSNLCQHDWSHLHPLIIQSTTLMIDPICTLIDRNSHHLQHHNRSQSTSLWLMPFPSSWSILDAIIQKIMDYTIAGSWLIRIHGTMMWFHGWDYLYWLRNYTNVIMATVWWWLVDARVSSRIEIVRSVTYHGHDLVMWGYGLHDGSIPDDLCWHHEMMQSRTDQLYDAWCMDYTACDIMQSHHARYSSDCTIMAIHQSCSPSWYTDLIIHEAWITLSITCRPHDHTVVMIQKTLTCIIAIRQSFVTHDTIWLYEPQITSCHGS